MPLLDLPASERQEAFCYTIVAILLTTLLPALIGLGLLAYVAAVLWAIWLVWLIFVQPMLFPIRPDVDPSELERMEAAKWMESVSTVDPTSFKLLEREVLALRQELKGLKPK